MFHFVYDFEKFLFVANKAYFPNAQQSTIEKRIDSTYIITCVSNVQIINLFYANAALLACGIYPTDGIHEQHF